MFHVEHHPSELIRSWLRREYDRGRLKPASLAEALGVRAGAVHNWLAPNARRVPDQHWAGIANFFDFATPEALLLAARERVTRDILLAKKGRRVRR